MQHLESPSPLPKTFKNVQSEIENNQLSASQEGNKMLASNKEKAKLVNSHFGHFLKTNMEVCILLSIVKSRIKEQICFN